MELVELEAVFSKATQVIAWRALKDIAVWRQGLGMSWWPHQYPDNMTKV